MHSKGYIINKNNINNDNDEIDKEPTRILIDKRLDTVKDWEIIEKVSRINEITKNSSLLVKNKYNRDEHRIKPKYALCINQFINTIIIPDR